MSSLRVTTAPTFEPVTLAEARAHVRIDGGEQDGLLAGYLIAARQFCERDLGRALAAITLQLTLDHDWPCDRWGRPCIALPQPPATAVSLVQYVDTNGTTQTLASNQYLFSYGDTFGLIVPAFGVTWPTVRDQIDTITVAFTAGYGSNPGDTPEPIRQAILLLVGTYFDNREGSTISAGRVTDAILPLGVDTLLAPYRTYW